jgi:pimeloyl-ACP methyl ester carboxylesterase
VTAATAEFEDIWYRSGDGLQLYARDYPCAAATPGPTLLCMHGLTRNSADFHGLSAQLCQRHRVIAVDQRGRGRSQHDSDPSRYTPATYVQDMFALLDYLQLQRVVLIGTSMGGLMSFIMAAMQPERIQAMVINDIGPEIDPAGLRRLQGYVGKSAPVANWDEALAQAKQINGIAFPDFSEAQWWEFTRGLYVEQDGVPVLAYDPAIAQPMADAGSGAVPPDLWPVFQASSQIPMLLLRGASSDILAPPCVAKMREQHPGLAFTEIPNRGHAPTLTEAEALAAIDAFLRAL